MSCDRCAKQVSTALADAGIGGSIEDLMAAYNNPTANAKPDWAGEEAFAQADRDYATQPNGSKMAAYAIKQGRTRCRTCGRFAKKDGEGHLCPATVTPEATQKTLARRTGLPAESFPADLMGDIVAEIKEAGSAKMYHPMSGEEITCEADALPLALAQGYVHPAMDTKPAWLVSNGKGQVFRIATPPNEVGLEPYNPANDAISRAAAYFGCNPMGTSGVFSAGTTSMNAESLASPRVADFVSLDAASGQTYDVGRLFGSEFRKRVDRDQTIPCTPWKTGDVIKSPRAFSHLRNNQTWKANPLAGKDATTQMRVVASCKTAPAIAKLKSGEWVAVADQGKNLTEVYATENGKPARLLAVCRTSQDGKTVMTGDTEGNNRWSEAQAAAFVAHMADPQNPTAGKLLGTDYNPIAHDLQQDNPLPAADSMYMLTKRMFEGRKVVPRKKGQTPYTQRDHTLIAGCSVSSPYDPDQEKWLGSRLQYSQAV